MSVCCTKPAAQVHPMFQIRRQMYTVDNVASAIVIQLVVHKEYLFSSSEDEYNVANLRSPLGAQLQQLQ